MSFNKESLVKFFVETFGIDVSSLGDDAPLFSSGILDSFSVAELLLFLEESCDMEIDPDEVVLENLDTIHSIMDFATRQK